MTNGILMVVKNLPRRADFEVHAIPVLEVKCYCIAQFLLID